MRIGPKFRAVVDEVVEAENLRAKAAPVACSTRTTRKLSKTNGEKMTTTRTSETNGRLWGARAREWAEVQEGQCAAAYHAVLKHAEVSTGTSHLDVGCGSGMAAQLSASLGAKVAGIDAAETLLEIARERTPAGDFKQGDLEALPFTDASFDLVTGFNAFQFAGDPGQALREAGPFALSDETALRAFVASGGLKPVEVFDVNTHWSYVNEAQALCGINSSGVAFRTIEHSGEQAVIDAHRAALAKFRQPDGSFRIGARFRCLVAAP